MIPDHYLIAQTTLRAPDRLSTLTIQVLYQNAGVAEMGKRHLVRTSQEGVRITQTEHQNLESAMIHTAGLIEQLTGQFGAFFPNENGDFW